MTLLTAIHISPDEKEYFMKYAMDASEIEPKSNITEYSAILKDFERKHSDFGKKLIAVAKTPESFWQDNDAWAVA